MFCSKCISCANTLWLTPELECALKCNAIDAFFLKQKLRNVESCAATPHIRYYVTANLVMLSSSARKSVFVDVFLAQFTV